MDNEFLLEDRLQKIRSVVGKYGEENFYISFSGGKDSTVLSWLIDRALPGNMIPRVFANTGLEYKMIVDFVHSLQLYDNRITEISPTVNIKDMLNNVGYPFKSKKHSALLETYQKYKTTENRPGIQHYLGISDDGVKCVSGFSCPDKLRCQFTNDYPLKISDRCCEELKEKPVIKWAKDNKRKYAILGIMRAEGGRRSNSECMVFRGGKFTTFQPLAPVDKKFEDWLIETFNINICLLYAPPYNFRRTGCKGCPFTLRLQRDLDVMGKFFPAERKQCEIIWEPVYAEYRRLHYRLKGE